MTSLAPGRVWNNVAIAWQQIVRRPLRNLLVLQGIIWGAALALWAPGAIQGSHENAFEHSRTYHLDRIVITPDAAARTANPFTTEDVDAVGAALGPTRLLHLSAMGVQAADVVTSAGEQVETHLLRVRPGMAYARDFHVERGRYVLETDVRDRRRICVLEPGISARLFPDRDPIGQSISVALDEERSITLEVVGLMGLRNQKRLTMDALGMSMEKSQQLREQIRWVAGVSQEPGKWERDNLAIHVPRSLLHGAAEELTWIYLRVKEIESLEECADIAAATLAGRGREPQLFYDASLPFIVGDQLQVYAKLNRAIYMTCVVMGVIVVTIIILAGVMSRTHEIGIRMVEGATRADIAMQFVTESAILCLAGALMGIPAAFLLGEIWLMFELSQFAQFVLPIQTTIRTISLVVGFGIIAGILPAWRAASLDPIAALRAGE